MVIGPDVVVLEAVDLGEPLAGVVASSCSSAATRSMPASASVSQATPRATAPTTFGEPASWRSGSSAHTVSATVTSLTAPPPRRNGSPATASRARRSGRPRHTGRTACGRTAPGSRSRRAACRSASAARAARHRRAAGRRCRARCARSRPAARSRRSRCWRRSPRPGAGPRSAAARERRLELPEHLGGRCGTPR